MFTIAIGWDKFRVGQFCGYLIVVTGCLIYYEILVIPIFGFNVNLKKNLNKQPIVEAKPVDTELGLNQIAPLENQ